MNRRQALKRVGAAGAGLLLPRLEAAESNFEIAVTPVSPRTFSLSILPIQDGKAAAIPLDGSLVRPDWGKPAARLSSGAKKQTIKLGDLRIAITPEPLEIAITSSDGAPIQTFPRDAAARKFATEIGRA